MEFLRSNIKENIFLAVKLALESLEYKKFVLPNIYTNRSIIVQQQNNITVRISVQTMESLLFFTVGYRTTTKGNTSDFIIKDQFVNNAAKMLHDAKYRNERIQELVESFKEVFNKYCFYDNATKELFPETVCLYRIINNDLDILEADKKYNVSLYSAREALFTAFINNAKQYNLQNNFDSIIPLAGIFVSQLDESFLVFNINVKTADNKVHRYTIYIERLSVTGSQATAISVCGPDGVKIVKSSVILLENNNLSNYFSSIKTAINEKIVFLNSYLKKITSKRDHQIICCTNITKEEIEAVYGGTVEAVSVRL